MKTIEDEMKANLEIKPDKIAKALYHLEKAASRFEHFDPKNAEELTQIIEKLSSCS